MAGLLFSRIIKVMSMSIRAYYWKERIYPRWKIVARDLIKKDGYNYFSIGNAGDILVRDILNWYYKQDVQLIKEEGNRLLLVGSINHQVKEKDVLLGVGSRSEQIDPKLTRNIKIFGLRGPKSYDAFKSSGYDVSTIKFLYDPGLLVPYLWDYSKIDVEPNKVIFIPHFRDKGYYRKAIKGIKMLDIDNRPEVIAKEIYSSEFVYTSSLHGLIFAHALGRPVRLVMPQSKEPIFKYEDYLLSIGQTFEKPIDDLYSQRSFCHTQSPVEVRVGVEDFYFPSLQKLSELGV